MNDIEKYFAEATPEQRAEFERLKKIVKQVAPAAEESISYGIPTFKVNKNPLIYFGAFADHISLFPASDEMIEAMPELTKHRSGKGTLRFVELPNNELLKNIVEFRLKQV